MEWGDRGKASTTATATAVEGSAGGEEPLGYVKVMTDEQIEVLRKQISIYTTICEQLVEMHRALAEHQDSISGQFSPFPCTQANPQLPLVSILLAACSWNSLEFGLGNVGDPCSALCW
jgi:hypothetical protein